MAESSAIRVSSEYIEHQDRVESVDELQQFAEADDTQICSGETYQITSAMVASNISVESRLSFNMNYMDTVEPSRQTPNLEPKLSSRSWTYLNEAIQTPLKPNVFPRPNSFPRLARERKFSVVSCTTNSTIDETEDYKDMSAGQILPRSAETIHKFLETLSIDDNSFDDASSQDCTEGSTETLSNSPTEPGISSQIDTPNGTDLQEFIHSVDDAYENSSSFGFHPRTRGFVSAADVSYAESICSDEIRDKESMDDGIFSVDSIISDHLDSEMGSSTADFVSIGETLEAADNGKVIRENGVSRTMRCVGRFWC